jgi:polyferredoxin
MIALFFMMMRTWSTYRWRRWFFVALGILFPVGFIHMVMVMRGSMGIPMEEMIAGRTPFCYLPIPLLILPAALTKTLVFPGSILPGGGMSGSGMAAMAGLWLAITIVVGKGWCSYACFFGGIEEGMSSLPKRAKVRKIDPRWRYGPWAVLLAMVLLSLALFEPAYCMWLCPFKAVSEYVAARNTVGLVQNGIFVVLFAGLVIVLPLLTKKRTQCAFFCPFGAFQSIFNKASVFDVKIDQSRCSPCVLCQNACPTLSLTAESISRGETLMSCMKCGACVDACPKHAAVWHISRSEAGTRTIVATVRSLGNGHDVRRHHHRPGPCHHPACVRLGGVNENTGETGLHRGGNDRPRGSADTFSADGIVHERICRSGPAR